MDQADTLRHLSQTRNAPGRLTSARRGPALPIMMTLSGDRSSLQLAKELAAEVSLAEARVVDIRSSGLPPGSGRCLPICVLSGDILELDDWIFALTAWAQSGRVDDVWVAVNKVTDASRALVIYREFERRVASSGALRVRYFGWFAPKKWNQRLVMWIEKNLLKSSDGTPMTPSSGSLISKRLANRESEQ